MVSRSGTIAAVYGYPTSFRVNCAVRHFCGAPCPAEGYTVNGGMAKTGTFCELYEEQARYALRLIADGKEEAFLWNGWDAGEGSRLSRPESPPETGTR